MSTVTLEKSATHAVLETRRHLWTVEDYQRMATLGLFAPEERTELINGEIIDKMPPSPDHSLSVDLIRIALAAAFAGQDCFLRSENPVRLPGIRNQPQPDIAVVRGNPRLYPGRFPAPEDILLLIETAYSSEDFDRDTKAPLYAAAGIPEYWIVNLKARTLEVYRDPQNGVYATLFTVPATGTVSPLAAPESVVLVADLLP